MAEAVRIFTRIYGEYPYRELEIVATPTSAGGVEYPGIIAINQTLYVPGEKLSGMRSEDLVESVVVHEVAHDWFYNMVGNDQGREPWLDEAMAQYMTWQYFQERYGPAAGQGVVDSWWSRWHRVRPRENADRPAGGRLTLIWSTVPSYTVADHSSWLRYPGRWVMQISTISSRIISIPTPGRWPPVRIFKPWRKPPAAAISIFCFKEWVSIE